MDNDFRSDEQKAADAAAAAAAALAASGQRAEKLTAQELNTLRAQVNMSVVRFEKTAGNGTRVSIPGTIIAATPTYSYVLLLKRFIADCEVVFLADDRRLQLSKTDFIPIHSHVLAIVKINHGSVTPIRLTERAILFKDSVYLPVLDGRGLTPGSVVNPTGESKPSHFPAGVFAIDNGPDQKESHGAPVFDGAGEFLGVTYYRPSTVFVLGASKIKELLGQSLPEAVLGELRSLNVL